MGKNRKALIWASLLILPFIGFLPIAKSQNGNITYNAVTNTITVTTYSEVAPCTFLDIYNADVAGGWGVVTRQGIDQYCFECKLIIGNAVNVTWLIDKEVQIVFDPSSVSSNGEVLINIFHLGYCRFGRLVNLADKITDRGVSFLDETTYEAIRLFNIGNGAVGSNSFVQCYDCIMINTEHGQLKQILNYPSGTVSRFWNCIIEGIGLWGNENLNYDIFRLRGVSTTRMLDHPNGIFDTLYLDNNDPAIYFYYTMTCTIKNIVARGNTLFIYVWRSRVNNFIINGDVDNWAITWYPVSTHNIYRQYTFDLAIFFDNGTPFQNANVTISNDYLGTSDSWLTFANGSIPMQVYSMGHYDQAHGNDLQDYNPYNLTVTFDGYKTYSTLINITKKEDLKISLHEKEGGGFALDFDGVDDYVEVQDDTSLNFGSDDFSVQVWIKTTSSSVGIVNKWGYDTDIGYFLCISGTPIGKMMIYLTDGTNYVQTTTDESVNDGKWHLLTFTRSNALKFYIDDSLVKEVDVSAIGNINNDDPLLFGVLDSDGHSDWLNGTMDEPLFYSREINSTEITYSYNNGDGRYEPLNQTGLVAWYHFDEGSGTSVLDETSNNNDGVLYGDTDEWVIGKIKPVIPPSQFFPYFGLGALFALMIGLVLGLALGSSKRK